MIILKAHSWCEKIIFASISVICIILGLDYKFTILPINGILLIAYLFFVTITATWITFIYLQNLLQNEKPFEYNLEKNAVLKFGISLYNFLSKFNNQLATSKPQQKNQTDGTSPIPPTAAQQEIQKLDSFQNADTVDDIIDSKIFQKAAYTQRRTKNIDERIDDLIKDIEMRFILRWYVNISSDPSFPSEAQAILDEVIRRFLQIVVEVDGRKLVYGWIIIFLKHIKEFRKTLKRSQKSDGTIEELYRYSHIGSKSQKAMEHFIFRLTANISRQFINWELWNSLPCRSLVAILSRRFTSYIITYVSSPGFLNYKIVQACASESTLMNLKLDDYYFISIGDVDHSGSLRQLIKPSVLPTDVRDKIIEDLKHEESGTPKISPKRVTKRITPDLAEDPAPFDVVDSGKKPKQAEDCQHQNGIADKVADTVVDDGQTPVKTTTETKLNEVDKTASVQKVETRPKASEPVKIYESKSATKTWRNSSDLECISLGQDLLAFQEFTDPDSQIQELIEKKLWKDNTDTIDEEKPSSMWDIPESWFGEEEVSEPTDGTVLSPTSNFQNYITSAANTALKPIGDVTASTLHNMKEFQQSTVNTVNTVVKPMSQATHNAMHKIGDLQNTTETPMQCLERTQDEAAGMVEGILDFGMAGLRKGLRLTGLQENFSELTQKARHEFHRPDSHKPIDIQKPGHGKTVEIGKVVDKDVKKYGDNHKNSAKLVKTPHVASEDKLEQPQSSSESDESVWINPLNKDSPSSFDGHILLEKTPDSAPKPSITDTHKLRKISDSSDSDQKPPPRGIPQITEDILLPEDSPDPEYEEAQDLASTIAKLRTLLQQKSSESGFTTPSLSPMPQDDSAKTPSEPSNADLTKVDGAMPSLYKFCARTATGVFQNTLNTIKTALPGNVNEATQGPVRYNIEDWTFVEADGSNDDFNSRMKKLLSERRAYCTVDTAYEAIDSLEVVDQPDSTWTVPTTQFDDELDEFDVQVPITKALIDIVCELIGDTNTCLLQESVIKALLLLIGNYSEEFITKQSDTILHNVNKFVGKLPENINQEVIAMKLEEMVKICMERFPGHAKALLGESTVETGVNLFIFSLQSQRINQDIFMQMFELFASELINACSQVSPAYSA